MEYRFEDFVVDTARKYVKRDCQAVPVEPKIFDLLVYLIEKRDRVVSKDDLVAGVWQGRIISDATISSAIGALRRALGDDGRGQRFIRTVHSRGFRFVGTISEHRTEHAVSRANSAWRTDIEDMPSIAVLPFTATVADPDREHFADGLCEDVITALGRIGWLFVIAWTSTMGYREKPVDASSIARDLGVRYLLTGTLADDGMNLRVSAQLLEAQSARQIWAERYDCVFTDIFAVRDEITRSIVAALEPQVSTAESRITGTKPEEDLNAWECVVRAMALQGRFNREGSAEAIRLLKRALEIDPQYARAHAQYAWHLTWRIHQGWEHPNVALPIAIASAEAAVNADSDEPWAYIAWLFIATIKRDAVLLIDSPRRALEINPNFAMAHSWMGASLALTGNGVDAFRWIDQARKLSPRDIFKHEFDVHTAYAHFQVGDYVQALASAHRAMLPHPDHVYPRLMMAASMGRLGDTEAGAAQLERIRELAPTTTVASVRASCVFISPNEIERFIHGLELCGLE